MSPYAVLLFGGGHSDSTTDVRPLATGGSGGGGGDGVDVLLDDDVRGTTSTTEATHSAVRVQHSQGTITVGPDAWARFKAPAKIGVLVKQLRKALDMLLAAKITHPSLDITNR